MRTRKRKSWRARVSFLTSVLVAGAGTCVPVAFALVVGNAPSHTMSLNSIQTHGRAGGGFVVGSASVIMQYKFQLSFVFFFVPPIKFID